MSNKDFLDQMFGDAFGGPSSARLPQREREERRAHIDRLAQEHGATVNEADIHPYEAEALVSEERSVITVPRLENELAYLIALHELGHIALDLQSFECRDGQRCRLFMNEARVWEWVLDEAEFEVSDDAREKIPLFLVSDDQGDDYVEARVHLAEVLRRKPV